MSKLPQRLASALEVEALAETLSWQSGEFTRYSPTAHPDHNRWSWQGDGHGPVLRKRFLDQARLIIGCLAVDDTSTGSVSEDVQDVPEPPSTERELGC